MIQPWSEVDTPVLPKPNALQWLRFLVRAVLVVVVTGPLLVIMLMFQMIEKIWPLGVANKIVGIWARICLWISGLGLRVHGKPMDHAGAIVTNHGSWLDILTMFSASDVHFVAKSEVAGWPVIGWLARQIGTLFIERRRTQAGTHQGVLKSRLDKGDRLCFFPEGTSTDSLRVLPFRSSLFAAFMTDDLRDQMWIQAATVIYTAPSGRDPAFYGWWGDMEIGPHIVSMLALSNGGRVDVHFHAPKKVTEFSDRKALARQCETEVRACFENTGKINL